MSLDLTGITSENEFYTHHYLSAIMEGDLKGVLGEWKRREQENNIRSPYAELRGLTKNYFTMCNRLEREKDKKKRLNLQREFFEELLSVFGFEFNLVLKELDDGFHLPVIGEIRKNSGAPELWIIEAFDPLGDKQDPLLLSLCACQYPQTDETLSFDDNDESFEDIITRRVLGQSEPPRWVILLSDSQIILLDRTKWNEKRLLRFDLTEILGRREPSTLQAMSALLHRDSICPSDGLCLLDTLDENSHKHAFAVSEDLKYALREAVELLGNEAVWFLREKLHEKVYGQDLASKLTLECLRYMYRLLFLFYIEARPELEYAPMKVPAYLRGYSLETLRDLEMINLTTEESKNGFFIHESIKLLFDMVYNGFEPEKQLTTKKEGDIHHHIFRIPPLKSHLFDPERTPTLSRVRFRNHVLQQVIKLMSLSRPKGKKVRRGRISYSQLGINQLGAVYEGLLSYKGFFAETDLYEVKKAKDTDHDELDTAYFVKEEDLEKYSEDERVYNDDGKYKIHPKASFVYRLAGRDREKSASYYTPEVLTRCLVKYALKELLVGKSADDILNLTVCEPAMGSAAFLNEAVNQLAEEYLKRKQKETGQIIKHEDYTREKQKVKMHIADNNVFGVDLNPVAVELAEVSLWLNTIHRGAFVPWFGMQITCGNSLVGARRQVYSSHLLKKNLQTGALWLDEAPKRLMPNEKRSQNSVYHFLLPDPGMADYKDKVVRQMAKTETDAIKDWRKDFVKPFYANEIQQLEKLSHAVDRLWEKHTRKQRSIRDQTTNPIDVFGQPQSDRKRKDTTTEWKDRIYRENILLGDKEDSSFYRRLKMAMDYWCALWFWPIEKADLLPSRADYMLELSIILEGNFISVGPSKMEQLSLFPDKKPKQQMLDSLVDDYGFVDVEKLCRDIPRLGLVKELAEKYRFLHWELEFADLFAERGGFDLVLGNPPWIKVTWRKENILGEFEPFIIIKNKTAPQVEKHVYDILNTPERRSLFLEEYTNQTSTKNYLNAIGNYPLLKGLQSNLYKCFLTQGWHVGNNNTIVALIHMSELLSESKGILIQEVYKRLCSFWHFSNALRIFQDVKDTRKFAATITQYSVKSEVNFYQIVNIFHPQTIDLSFEHNGYGITPGIKSTDNKWEIKGHNKRIVNITEEDLSLFRDLFENPELPLFNVRLPLIHSSEILSVLRKVTQFEKRFSDIERYSTMMFDETNAQNAGIINKSIGRVNKAEDLILSGSHIYNCNPFYQEVPDNYKNIQDFKLLELSNIGCSFYPRTIYKLTGKEIPRTVGIDRYRNARRKMVYPMSERTLITAIIPPGAKHINGIISEYFEDYDQLLIFTGLTNSLIYDFFIKIIGKSNIYEETIKILPFIPDIFVEVKSRVLRLNCLTQNYAELWESSFNERFQNDDFVKFDPRLSKWNNLTSNWDIDTPLRNPFERKQALIEIDVLVAMAMGITLEELCTIYRIQFPILYKNEKGTWYDQTGRIVYSVNTACYGINRKDVLEKWDKTGTKEIDGYYPPFDTFDREEDYTIAWTEFERRFNKEKG